MLDLNIASHGMEQAKKKKAEKEWSNDEHGNGIFLSWGLRLQTSGIYRSCRLRLLAVTDDGDFQGGFLL